MSSLSKDDTLHIFFYALKKEIFHPNKTSGFNVLSPVYFELGIIAFYIFFHFSINHFYNKSA